MQKRPIGHALTRLGEWAAHPAAFGLALLYAVCWLIFDHESLNCTGNRADRADRQEIIKIDHREPEDIEKHRARAQATANDG